MAFRTLQQIVNNVITELGLVAGSAVQLYTEPQCVLAVNRMFDYLMDKQQWDHLWTWERYALDGVTGTVVGGMETIRDAGDIGQIRSLTGHRDITRSIGTQHLDAQGTDAVYYSVLAWNHPQAAGLVQFWPPTATGVVDVYALHRPETFVGGTDVVPFNPLVIELAAAWYVLQGDGLNAANAEKVKIMFDLAYQNYASKLNAFEIGHGVGYQNGQFSVRQ
jgi:hypothetical protein